MASFHTYQAIGMREDLSNTIYNIAPTETPVVSSIGKTKATATLHEWQTDTLGAAANTALVEGADAAAFTAVPTVRATNRTQIMGKTVNITGTLDGVDKAGRKTETAYQLAKAGQELKRDIEFAILGNVAPVTSAAGAAPKMASLQTWIRTNWTSVGTASAGPTAPVAPAAPPGSAIRTKALAGNTNAFTEVSLKAAMKAAFNSGGSPTMLVVPPNQKVKVSGFAGIAANRVSTPNAGTTTKAAAIVGAADVYLSDFGMLSVIPERFMTSDYAANNGEQALILDPTMLSLATLRPFQSNLLAKTGDAEKHQMLTELTLQVSNEAAHAIVADLNA
tara:strand:+ start:313 stop:1314 length:1002 start_codon:yes stop_codon:yes gene_type:complete